MVLQRQGVTGQAAGRGMRRFPGLPGTGEEARPREASTSGRPKSPRSPPEEQPPAEKGPKRSIPEGSRRREKEGRGPSSTSGTGPAISPWCRRTIRCSLGPSQFREVIPAGAVDHLVFHLRRNPFVLADLHHAAQYVVGMARAQPDPPDRVLLVEQVADGLLAELESEAFAHLPADGHVFLFPQIVDLDLVPDPSEKRLVGQLARFDVRRKQDDLVERNLELLPVLEGEVVARLFQGNDPSVEEIEWPDELAPEVIDEEDPAVGLHLKRRFIEFGNRVEAEVKHRKRQFAPGDHHGALAENPSAVVLRPVPENRLRGVRRCAQIDFAVVHGIVDPDYLVIHVQCVGNEDVPPEHLGDVLRDEGLAVSGGAVEEYRATRVHRRPETVEKSRRQNYPLKRPLHRLPGHRHLPDRLPPCDLRVLPERHRRRSHVTGERKIFLCPLPPEVGDRIGIRGPDIRAFLDFRKTFLLHELHHIADHADGQRDLLRNGGEGHHPSEIKHLARKLHHESHGEPGVLHVLGGFGQRRDPDLACFLSQGRIRSHVSLPKVSFGCRSPREEPASSYLPARGRTVRGPRAVSPGGQEGTACPVSRVAHGPRVPPWSRGAGSCPRHGLFPFPSSFQSRSVPPGEETPAWSSHASFLTPYHARLCDQFLRVLDSLPDRQGQVGRPLLRFEAVERPYVPGQPLLEKHACPFLQTLFEYRDLALFQSFRPL